MKDIDTPLFAALPEPALERIRRTVQRRHFASGEAMLSEGEMRGELFIVLSGEALVVGRDWHGQQQVLARLGPGECFGELSMLSGEPASATVEATTETDVWVLPHADVVAIADEHPELARNLSALLAERLRISNERHLRARRGQLVALFAPDGPPWAFWLSYRLALSVAEHTRQPVTFLDLSGRAAEWLRPGPSVLSLHDAVREGGARDATAESRQPLDYLQVVAPDGADVPTTETQLTAAFGRLQQHARYVLTYVPNDAPEAEAVGRRADVTLLLAHESQVRGAASALASCPVPSDGEAGLVLVSEQKSVPMGADYRRAESLLDSRWRVRSIVPGGAQALEDDVPETSPTGFAIGRLARSIAGLTVGLALGGGGAKGYAHIGVVRVLQRAGVPFDCVTGCSIGAPLAAGVAAGWDLDVMRTHLDNISRKAIRPNVPLISILTSRSIRAELRDVTGNGRFEDVPTPLGIVAVDIETGEEVLLRSGLVWPAMVASMAYPGIYEPVRIGSHCLVDGGVLNPVPVSAAVTLGANLVISSNLSGPSKDRNAKPQSHEPKRRRLIIENIARSLEIMQSKIVEESCNRADVAIQPTFSDSPGLLDFKRGREFAEVGEEAAERDLPKLRSVLPWLS